MTQQMHSRDRALALVSKIPDQDIRRVAEKSLNGSADMNLMVRAFHQVYGLPIVQPKDARDDFTQITKARLAMRFGLIIEEFMELCEAMDIRADINFLYENENDEWQYAKSKVEKEQALESTDEELLGIKVVYDSILNEEFHLLDHSQLSDKALHQIVRERIADAVENTDERSIPDVADACFDLKYVIIGFEYEVGIEPQFCANEGQASNMSKLNRDGTVSYREDGKVLKGPDFFPPDMAKALRSWDMRGL